jgi:molybdopterin synthase catalytic subunit
VPPHCGAAAVSLGATRGLTGDRVNIHLDHRAYPPMAEKKPAEIEAEIRRLSD